MNVAEIEVSRDVAIEKLADYRRDLKVRRTREDEEIARGFREVLRGRTLLSLRDTFRAAGFHEDGLPKLGVARATWEEAFVRTNRGSGLTFTPFNTWGWHVPRGGAVTQQKVVVRTPAPRDSLAASARVPLVPAHLRPTNLGRYHVLWEADWLPVPAADPALIKHVGGDLWVLIAVWDLTPLERAVLTR